MTEFFDIVLFEVGEKYRFTMLNLMLIGLLMVALLISLRFTKRFIKSYIKKVLPGNKIKVEGKKITISKLLIQIIYIIGFFLFLQCLQVNNPEFSFSDILTFRLIAIEQYSFSVYHIFVIFATIIGIRIFLNLLKLSLSKAAERSDSLDESTQYVLIQFTKYIIYTIAILLVISSFGVDVSNLILGSAALLVGVGLGLQDFFRDLFSGIILLFEGTIKVGDIIEVSDDPSKPELIARVLKINIRTTKITTRDGNYMIIPNSKLTQDYVHNWSFGDMLTRFKVKVSVAYGSDTELVRKLLRQAAEGHPKVYKSKPIIVRMLEFGDNGLEMDLVFWADQSWQIEIVKSEIRFEIDRLFREHNVVIPFPQRDVHHISYPSNSTDNPSLPKEKEE